MKAWALALVMLAGCGPVRVDTLRREGRGGAEHRYTRDDSDGRAYALEAADDDGCREDQEGRWVMAFCPEPDKIRAGVPTHLRFQMEARSGDKPGAGTLIAVALRHKGGRKAGLIHPDPVVSGVTEVSPGNYQAEAVFPAEGRWMVETGVMFPGGESLRLQFDVWVAPSAGGE